jgi:hypothetical protein
VKHKRTDIYKTCAVYIPFSFLSDRSKGQKQVSSQGKKKMQHRQKQTAKKTCASAGNTTCFKIIGQKTFCLKFWWGRFPNGRQPEVVYQSTPALQSHTIKYPPDSHNKTPSRVTQQFARATQDASELPY